jgi:hypothetical protein
MLRIVKAWFMTVVIVRAIVAIVWALIGPANRIRVKALLRNI